MSLYRNLYNYLSNSLILNTFATQTNGVIFHFHRGLDVDEILVDKPN